MTTEAKAEQEKDKTKRVNGKQALVEESSRCSRLLHHRLIKKEA